MELENLVNTHCSCKVVPVVDFLSVRLRANASEGPKQFPDRKLECVLHIARSGLNWRNTVQVVLIGLSLHHLGTPGKLNVMLDVRRILGLHEHLLSAPYTALDLLAALS